MTIRIFGNWIAGAVLALAASSHLAVQPTFGQNARPEKNTPTLHFAPNGNFSRRGIFLPSQAGFNLADVASAEQLNLLPDGVKGLFWVGLCNGVDAAFLARVQAVINHPNLFGFYLMDDPDPTGRWHPSCSPANLMAESDWIHAKRPGVVTFVALMNLSSSVSPSFDRSYTPVTSHVDLFGVGPYPCRTEFTSCDYDMIDRFVVAAVKSGIPLPRIIPTYQTFGGGTWRTDGGGQYRMPNAAEMNEMLQRWKKLIPAPVFDYAYSWGVQRSDIALEISAELRDVFAQHNSAAGSSAVSPPILPDH